MHSSTSASNNRAGRPAVSTDGLDDHGVSPWLDQFFGNCSLVGCNRSKIAFIAFHDYQGDVSKILSRAEGLLRRYGKPTWITEFAVQKWARERDWGRDCNECNITRAMQDDYMRRVLPALEKSEAVHRYAWYSARDRPQPQISMVRFPACPLARPLLLPHRLAMRCRGICWCGTTRRPRRRAPERSTRRTPSPPRLPPRPNGPNGTALANAPAVHFGFAPARRRGRRRKKGRRKRPTRRKQKRKG